MSSIVCVLDRQDFELQMDETKKRHKNETANAKKNGSEQSVMKKLKEKQGREIENLKSAFKQIKHKKPRHEENWIPLGQNNDQLDEYSNENIQTSSKCVLPEQRRPDPLRSIENNKAFQVERKQCLEASKQIKRKLKNSKQSNGEQMKTNFNMVNSLAKAKELKIQQQTKRKAENQEIDD